MFSLCHHLSKCIKTVVHNRGTLIYGNDESLFTAEIILIVVFIHSEIHRQQSYEDTGNKVIVV